MLTTLLTTMPHFNETDFNTFRTKHPEMRYFQALSAYLGKYVYVSDNVIAAHGVELEDTFYWQDDK